MDKTEQERCRQLRGKCAGLYEYPAEEKAGRYHFCKFLAEMEK